MESTPQMAFLVCGLGQFPEPGNGVALFRLLSPLPQPIGDLLALKREEDHD